MILSNFKIDLNCPKREWDNCINWELFTDAQVEDLKTLGAYSVWTVNQLINMDYNKEIKLLKRDISIIKDMLALENDDYIGAEEYEILAISAIKLVKKVLNRKTTCKLCIDYLRNILSQGMINYAIVLKHNNKVENLNISDLISVIDQNI